MASTVHDDQSVCADAGANVHDQTHLDILGHHLGSRHAVVDHVGDTCDQATDLHEAIRVVHRHDLRSAENLQAVRVLKRSQQETDRIASGTQYEATIAEVVVDLTHSKAGDTTRSQVSLSEGVSKRQSRGGVKLLQSIVIEVEACVAWIGRTWKGTRLRFHDRKAVNPEDRLHHRSRTGPPTRPRQS